MTVRRIPAIAGADVPHGAYCRLERGKAFPAGEADGSGGICAGPHPISGFTPKGQPVQLQTDGGVMALVTGSQNGRWARLRDGRIVG